MSWHDCPKARAAADNAAAIDTVIIPRSRDIGGFEVRRALPARERRMIGPFVFLDQMGRNQFAPGAGLDVRPHPHIGLATVTYLFSGEILHRDSLGTVQTIRPGELNWMNAGRGIVHSERTPVELRERGSELFGMQAWVALPQSQEESAPTFVHHGSEALPVIDDSGLRLRLIAGAASGAQSPVQTASETLYAEAQLAAGALWPVDATHEELGLYVAAGEVQIEQQCYAAGQLIVLRPDAAVTVSAISASRVMLLGGDSIDGRRHLWWNFVSSSKERIEQAKADWRAGRFDRVIDEEEWIPLPDLPGP
ncbi:MAG: pirin family protein [Wenzhouxiangellaceae bacterium]